MDALGLILSAALCTAVFVVFDQLVRLLGDAVGEIRYTVAPTVLGGLRAWAEDGDGLPARAVSEPPDGPEPPATDGRGPGRYRPDDAGLVVPVTPVRRHRARCAA